MRTRTTSARKAEIGVKHVCHHSALVSGTGTKGFYYKVSVAGSTAVNGISQWNIGNTIIFDGTTWDKIDGIANEVVSVAGRTGAVVLAVADVTGAQAALTAGQLPGEPAAGSATAGNVGEYIESVVVSGSAVALTTGVDKTITSISLTAGDWDIDAVANFGPAATTNITQLMGSVSSVK